MVENKDTKFNAYGIIFNFLYRIFPFPRTHYGKDGTRVMCAQLVSYLLNEYNVVDLRSIDLKMEKKETGTIADYPEGESRSGGKYFECMSIGRLKYYLDLKKKLITCPNFSSKKN